MKRSFVEPQMKVMAVNLRENIAASCVTQIPYNGLSYCVDTDNKIVGTATYSYAGNSGNVKLGKGQTISSSCLYTNRADHTPANHE